MRIKANKVCVTCSKTFQTNSKTIKTCSHECAMAYQVKRKASAAYKLTEHKRYLAKKQRIMEMQT